MKKIKLPSDRHFAPRRPVRTALVAVGAVALVVLAVGTASVLHERSLNTAAAPRAIAEAPLLSHSEVAQVAQVVQDSVVAGTEQTDREVAAALLLQQQQQAAAAAAAQQSQHHSTGVAKGAPGSRVPFIASSDPNNANGGDYEDPGVYCQSHSASGNPPVCD